MAANPASIHSISPQKAARPKAGNSPLDTLESRVSKELVIAVCGPVGCGMRQVIGVLEEKLQSLNYKVEHIRLSSLMEKTVAEYDHLADLRPHIPPASATYAEKVENLQRLGNGLRKATDNAIGAKLAIKEIAVWREQHPITAELSDDNDASAKLASQENTAFIIDQLKHPEESIALRQVYGSVFYQIGVLANNDVKIQKLKDMNVDRDKATALIEIDRKESFKHGQHLERTLTHSDYYTANNTSNINKIKKSIDRFLCLVHGKGINTPTNDEIGMYAAFSSSLQSACLSRQVGAAICDENGNVLSTGKNDVPKFGGGLYSADDGENDNRCANYGEKCHNTDNINKLKSEIQSIISKTGKLSTDEIKAIIDELQETKINSIIEYSRAIHAEMDAIISLARNLNSSSMNTKIYTTTFPCHNCARHIVAAGIKKIIYIEPYEKSLALDLHGDSICRDGSASDKLSIEPFEGAAPRKYHSFFIARGDRKERGTGRLIASSSSTPTTVEKVIVASYTDIEKKLTAELDSVLNTPA